MLIGNFNCMNIKDIIAVFRRTILDYHQNDNVEQPINNPYLEGTYEFLLYSKNWIDTVQWHLEDIIRDPKIDPEEALSIKRRIDKSNQERTDMVEHIDDYYMQMFADVKIAADATINTESPAWAIDRLSILELKIYHMNDEVNRKDVSEEHVNKCQSKLNVLLEQENDLSTAIEQLLDDMKNGRKYMKVYRQMKMYNDPNLNPVLYERK